MFVGHPGKADEPVAIDELLFELLGRSPDALRSLREPVGAMLHRVGLATHREFVGVVTTDWAGHERWEAAAEWAIREAWANERDRWGCDPDPGLGLDAVDWEATPVAGDEAA